MWNIDYEKDVIFFVFVYKWFFVVGDRFEEGWLIYLFLFWSIFFNDVIYIINIERIRMVE